VADGSTRPPTQVVVRKRSRRVATFLRRLRALLVTVVLVAVVCFLLAAANVVQHGRRDDARTADVILVLGAAQFDGRPQAYLTARLEHARDLYRSGTAPRIVTVGGKRPGDRFTEAEAGREWLTARGVPDSAVVPVGTGSDTLASVEAVADVMRRHRWRSAVVVTDPWHELRSTTMLGDQGITTYGSPTRTGPSVDGLGVKIRYISREAVAYLAYMTRHQLG
jgi:vancomycin permeability regulator SanA